MKKLTVTEVISNSMMDTAASTLSKLSADMLTCISLSLHWISVPGLISPWKWKNGKWKGNANSYGSFLMTKST